MTLVIKFLDGSHETIDDVIGYSISGEDYTLRVDIKDKQSILFNFDCVKSIRYVDATVDATESAIKSEQENRNIDEDEEFKLMMKRFFDGII